MGDKGRSKLIEIGKKTDERVGFLREWNSIEVFIQVSGMDTKVFLLGMSGKAFFNIPYIFRRNSDDAWGI